MDSRARRRSSPRPVALAGALLAVAACATTDAHRSPMQDALGRDMDFDAERLDAEGRLRLADLRGKVVMVDVMASWCVPCREAIPLWGELRERLGRDRFEVVGVSIDEDRDMARDFVAELAPSFPMVWDDGTLMQSFPVEGMPSLFLLDEAGIVRHVHEGFDAATPAAIELAARRLVAAPPAPR